VRLIPQPTRPGPDSRSLVSRGYLHERYLECAHRLFVAVAGVVLALRNLVGAELGDRPVGQLRFKVTY
jgi:hypothetical protein